MDSKDRPEPTVPAPPPAPAGAAPGASNIGQAMRRVIPHHWWKILAIWAVLSGGMVFAINKCVRPMYESSGMLRIEPANGDLFGQGQSSEAFGPFLQTQIELIRSPKVLGAALTSDEVAGTTLLKEAKDPEGELRAHLQVDIIDGTYLIRVRLTSLDPADGPKIVNEVIKQYIQVATEWADRKNRFQITRLNAYRTELNVRVDRQQRIWLNLAEMSVVEMIDSTRGLATSSDDLTLPQAKRNEVSLEEFRQIRERLFDTKMKLIETEALLKHREAELSARGSGADPELLLQQRIKDALRKDPEIVSMIKEIERVQSAQKVEALKRDLRDLIARKQEALALLHAGEDTLEDPSLHDMYEQVDSLKVRKGAYEKLLGQLQVTNAHDGSIPARTALAREDLNTLRDMRMTIEKRIEQLEFDSRGEARIQRIEEAKSSGLPVKDGRRKLWMATPVCVLALVFGLFLIPEIGSGPVADRDARSPRKPVSADEV